MKNAIAIIPDVYDSNKVGVLTEADRIKLLFEDARGNVVLAIFQLDMEGCEMLETALRVARQKVKARKGGPRLNTGRADIGVC